MGEERSSIEGRGGTDDRQDCEGIDCETTDGLRKYSSA